MARKKKDEQQNAKKIDTSGVVGLVGSTTEQAISETLEINYMVVATQGIFLKEKRLGDLGENSKALEHFSFSQFYSLISRSTAALK